MVKGNVQNLLSILPSTPPVEDIEVIVRATQIEMNNATITKSDSKTPTTYSSETRSGIGIFTAARLTVQEVLKLKWQIWIGFRKGFVASYRNTALGLVWAVALPLIPVSVYLLLAHIRVLKSSEDMPFVLFIVLGMVIYLFMTGTILSVMNSLDREKNILKKVNYPISAAMLSNFGSVAFDLLIRMLLVIPLLIYYGTGWHIGLVLLPLVLAVVFLFSMGVGATLAITSVILPDLKQLTHLVVTYSLFVSSVIFPMPAQGLIAKINLLNPLNTFVNSTRDLIVSGEIESITQFSCWSLVAILFALLACKLSYSMEFRIKEYL